MRIKMQVGGLLFGLLLLAQLCVAAPFVREANFYRVFDGQNYYSGGVDFNIDLSTMSSNGKIVAFYGYNYFNSTNHYKLFIHNFESTTDPVEVNLPPSVGLFDTFTGMISNADGSRIFFIAKDTTEYRDIFCMVNGLTGEVTLLLYTSTSGEIPIENPQDIATDANGDYLYFNENDNGYGTGDLWRIQTTGGALPELIIDADTIGHPSGGVGKFIDQFDVSDDGNTIAFFINGRDLSDGTSIRTDKELFVKTDSGIRFLTNNEQNSKGNLVISGDGSTIAFTGSSTGSYEWMVTTPDAAVEDQVLIESGYSSCGSRPGISTDGSILFGRSTLNGTSSCNGYLIKTDGSGRQMVEPEQINFLGTRDGLHLSGDGKRVFFKNRSYVYPDEWYNMTAGVFDRSLWTTEVPRITNVTYPADFLSKLENKERFDVNIGASDTQGDATIDNVDSTVLFPNGYKDKSGAGPINIYYKTDAVPGRYDLYTTEGYRGSSWPDGDPVTVRFAVEDQDGNISYADTELTISDLPPLLTQTQVSQLYVSIFGRASEGEGNAYWCSNQDNMVTAADTMLNTEPAKEYFGVTLNDNQAFIEFIYENTLGKTYAEDPDGVNYWVSELTNGKSKGQVIATLINAVMDSTYSGSAAQNQFSNKVIVCDYVADKITTAPDVNDLSAFVNFISGVTHDSATVTTSKTSVDAF